MGIITNLPFSGMTTTHPTNRYVGYGEHTWKAYGAYIRLPRITVYAKQTNRFGVVNPTAAVVQLLSHNDNTIIEEAVVAFDVLCENLDAKEMSTNNGWLRYTAEMRMKAGRYYWTARGGYGRGYVYALGTNLLIVRAGARMEVTMQAAWVLSDVAEYTVAGTANVGMVGGITWTKLLTGAEGSTAASTSRGLDNLPLGDGRNTISVRGTNMYGFAAVSQVQIVHRGPGTGVRVLQMTTPEPVGVTKTLVYAIEGTANTNVVRITWVNDFNGVTGALVGVESWTIANVPLEFWSNEIRIGGWRQLGMYNEKVFSVLSRSLGR